MDRKCRSQKLDILDLIDNEEICASYGIRYHHLCEELSLEVERGAIFVWIGSFLGYQISSRQILLHLYSCKSAISSQESVIEVALLSLSSFILES